MLFNAQNGILKMDNTEMEYIRFGTGEKALVFLPGLGDGLRSVKGTAVFMAMLYRKYAADYTVYMFSRKKALSPHCTTRDMAYDQKRAMDMLGIDKADIIGVSMGGMIAQHFAADHPEAVGKLVLVVTTAGQNPIIKSAVNEWIDFAKLGDHRAFMESNLRLIYSEKYYRNNRWIIPVIGALTKPKSYERFLIQAEACLCHDAEEALARVKAPTLIIGGNKDRVLGGEASKVLNKGIESSVLHIYPEGHHGLYEEEKGFNSLVLDFLKGEA